MASGKRPEGGRDAAEALAVEALGFLAADIERLEPFLSLTGLDPRNLRRAAGSPGFLAGVLEYVVGDERLLVAFADSCGHRPEGIVRAHALLAGPPPTATT